MTTENNVLIFNALPERATVRGAYVMETNSYDTEFFPAHYGGYRLEKVSSSSQISQTAGGRGKMQQYVIRNYQRRPRKAPRKGVLGRFGTRKTN